MKKILALILSAALLLALLAGCGSTQTTGSAPASEVETASVSESVQEAPEAAEPQAEEPAETASAVEPAATPEPVKFTGTVIPAEECQAEGYDVQYGMFDFETYVDLPITEEPETLTYWMMMQPFMMGYNNITVDDFTYFKEMESRTGVHLDITAVSMFSVLEQFSLMVTSGDYSDLVEGAVSYYTGGATKAIEDGFLMDLTELMEYMPNYEAWIDSNPKYRGDILTLNEEIAYAACFSETERNVGPQLRGDWLEELGLEIPETYDEYHDVLTAFKENYGGGLWLDSHGTQRNNVLSAGYDVHVNNQDLATRPFRLIDGTLEFDAATDDYRDFMRLMHQWYTEGLIYPDFLSQQDVSTPDANLVLTNQVSVWAADNNTMVTYDTLADDIDIQPAPLPRKEPGQQLHLYTAVGAISDGTSISTECRDPELAARWLDYNYTYDGTLLCGYGIEGEGLQFDAEGNPGYTDLVLNNPDYITVACSLMYSKFGGAGVIDAHRFDASYDEKQMHALDLWLTGLDTDHEFPSSVQFTTAESEDYQIIFSDLETYSSQAALQFITGEKDVEADWDSYLADLESLRMSELTELCQKAYDRYLEISEGE